MCFVRQWGTVVLIWPKSHGLKHKIAGKKSPRRNSLSACQNAWKFLGRQSVCHTQSLIAFVEKWSLWGEKTLTHGGITSPKYQGAEVELSPALESRRSWTSKMFLHMPHGNFSRSLGGKASPSKLSLTMMIFLRDNRKSTNNSKFFRMLYGNSKRMPFSQRSLHELP